MRIKLIGAYIAVVLSGLVSLALVLLLVLQWGNSCKFSLFGKNIEPNATLVIFIALVVGAGCPFLIRLLVGSARVILRHRRAVDAVVAKPEALNAEHASGN